MQCNIWYCFQTSKNNPKLWLFEYLIENFLPVVLIIKINFFINVAIKFLKWIHVIFLTCQNLFVSRKNRKLWPSTLSTHYKFKVKKPKKIKKKFLLKRKHINQKKNPSETKNTKTKKFIPVPYVIYPLTLNCIYYT